MNKGVSAGLICPTRLKKTVFVQEINAVQEFVNMPECLNKGVFYGSLKLEQNRTI